MIIPPLADPTHLPRFIALFLGSALIAMGTTRFLIDHLQKRQIMDHANARSMHETPVPVGGGWAIIPLTLLAWLAFFWPLAGWSGWIIPGGALVLALISFADDQTPLPQYVRMAAQALIILLALTLLPANNHVFSASWPLWMDRVLTGLCWLWFVNLFNFMDGIDGLAGTETLFICAGLIFIGLQTGFEMPQLYILSILAGATAGFLWWNWHPARIFLGDVGSIPLGFLLGWFLIQLAIKGHLAAALLLPAFFVTDASLTLVKRLLNKEAFWKPHKTHYYQKATMALGSHGKTLGRIIPANFALLALAIASVHLPLVCALAGIGVMALVLFQLKQDARG